MKSINIKTTDFINFNDKRIFIIIYFVIILAGIQLRLKGLACSFEYDEIWTIKNWLPLGYGELLSSVHNASNHPLSSVVMKFIYQFSGHNLFWLRFPHFICGIALLPVIYLNAKLLTRSRLAALLTLALATFHPGLIYYSHCARGYSPATFWLSLFALMSSYWIFKSAIMKNYQRYFSAAILVFSMIAACMSIPSVILFIVPIMLIHCGILVNKYWDKKNIGKALMTLIKPNFELITAWFIITLFAAFLYIGNYHKFQNAVGMAAGTMMTSTGSLWVFLNILFPKLIYWSILPLCVLPLLRKKQRKIFFACSFIFLFSFTSLIFAKGGPARTYLPVVPIFCFLAANGIVILSKIILNLIESSSYKLFILISVFLTCAAVTPSYRNDKWASINWFEAFANIKKIPRKKMIIYGACETYALANNINNHVYIDNFSRISAIRSDQKIIFIDIPNQTINGNNPQGGEVAYKITEKGKSVKIGNLPSTVYRLEKITSQSNIKNKTLLAVIPFMPFEQSKAAKNYLFTMPKSEWLLLNPFLVVSETIKGRKYSSAIMACPNDHKLQLEQILTIESKSKGKLRFYTLEDYK